MMEFISSTFTSYVALVPVTLSQSFILAFVVMGIMIPFRTLQFPDLTSEGAYPLGGCVCGVLIAAGVNPALAIVAALACGFLAGCCTALIHLRFRIHTLLAGILMMTMLYSINLRIMGKSNLSIFGSDTVYNWAPFVTPGFPVSKIIIAGLIGAGVFLALNWFFKTEKGTALRAVGSNPAMAEAQGISVWVSTIIGVGLASGFSATSGALIGLAAIACPVCRCDHLLSVGVAVSGGRHAPTRFETGHGPFRSGHAGPAQPKTWAWCRWHPGP